MPKRTSKTPAHCLKAIWKRSLVSRSNGWEEKNLGDDNLLEIIDGDRGVNYPKASDFYADGHCLFLNTKNVRPDGFTFESTMFITAKKDKELNKGKLKRDDVVMTTRALLVILDSILKMFLSTIFELIENAHLSTQQTRNLTFIFI